MPAVGKSYLREDYRNARAWVRRKLAAGLRVYVNANAVEWGFGLVAAPMRAQAIRWVDRQFEGMLPYWRKQCRMVAVKKPSELHP